VAGRPRFLDLRLLSGDISETVSAWAASACSRATTGIRSAIRSSSPRRRRQLEGTIARWRATTVVPIPIKLGQVNDFLQYREKLNVRRMARMKDLDCDLTGVS
jgi:hypothetical protein